MKNRITSIALVLIIWILYAILGNESIKALSIVSKDLNHVFGIITYHFIHSNLSHITGNTVALIMALFIFDRFFKSDSLLALLPIMAIVTGVFVYLFAGPGFHLGSSGLVYSLVFYMGASGFFRKQNEYFYITAVFLVFLIGKFVAGMIPSDNPFVLISWETHLSGGITGVVLAYARTVRVVKRNEF